MEIIDAELYAVYRAREHLKQQRLEEKKVYIFIDSQAAIKRLQLNALTGGQELVFKITQSCSYLASRNISINFYWVPSYLGIYGNKIADKLAKKGLLRRKIRPSYTSLAYIGRLAREKILK
jgi:ribonuclease HI